MVCCYDIIIYMCALSRLVMYCTCPTDVCCKSGV